MGAPGGPADRAVARALKESFGSVSLRGGAGGSDDVEAAAARVHVDVGRALDRADDPAVDDIIPAAADSDDSGYSGDDLGAYDGPAALRAGATGDGGGGLRASATRTGPGRLPRARTSTVASWRRTTSSRASARRCA